MKIKIFLYPLLGLLLSCSGTSRVSSKRSLNDFSQWRTGHDPLTVQLVPATGDDLLLREKNKTVVHVRFRVKQYGEVSFPLNSKTPEGAEALKTDLSESKAIHITYRANQEFILQLRQTGVHGGVHPHVLIPASKESTTVTIPFTEFKGGKTPLDLTDVAKFNFAFLSNNTEEGYAELKISSFTIDRSNNRKELTIRD